MPILWSAHSYKTLPSTQDELKNNLKNTPDLPEGFVVYAEKQTDGYGRHGRSWQSDNGNLYLSFLLRPKKDAVTASQLSLVTGLALTKSIQAFVNGSTEIILKWPNDVLIESKKCAGILIETNHNTHDNKYPALIIGLGVNIINSPLEHSTFLNARTTKPVALDIFRDKFLDIFSDYYQEWQKQGFKPFKDRFIRQTYAKDTPIGVTVGSQKITGQFKDIDDNGNLELLCDETRKLRKITSGDVFLI